jgi:HD-GYP domain-containing protein (c-di-GMP phosphodiesterase class II)
MITIYLAEFLGLQGEELHDAGIAGLLHDMGKLFIQKEIIEKDSSLTNEEWSAMQLHPIKGGLYLSKVPEIPKIAAVVAFEHHMKYDGSGYPQIKWRMKKQHIISSIVSIADFFDAMRSVRVYREKEKFHVSEILKILKEGSGTFFHFPDHRKTLTDLLYRRFPHALLLLILVQGQPQPSVRNRGFQQCHRFRGNWDF